MADLDIMFVTFAERHDAIPFAADAENLGTPERHRDDAGRSRTVGPRSQVRSSSPLNTVLHRLIKDEVPSYKQD